MNHKTGKKEQMKAAALQYNAATDDVPRIVGLGQGRTAQKILQTAAQNDIPIVEDEALVHVLNEFNVGDEIPEELYQMVAQVLVFLCGLDQECKKRFTPYNK
ncbi:MAG: EscU/YscU/HrcU family type III secretion system export apparatus switch protein [Christensenellales bacterium]